MSKFLLLVLLVLAIPVFGQKLLDPGGSMSVVTPSSGGSNSSVSAAYSIRQLKTNYDHPVTITAPAPVSGFSNSTTPLLRVRRSSDNGQLDIGYDGDGNLDTVLLKSFVSSNGLNPAASGFVTVWYDQSGNSRDVYPPTISAQPRIVNAGVVERNSGGRVGFYGVNGGMLEHRPTASTTFNGGSGANIYGISGDRTMNVVSQPKAYSNGGASDGSGTYLIDRYGDPSTANGGTPSGIDNPLTSLKAISNNWALQIRLQDGSGLANSFAGSVSISTNRSDNVMVVRSGSNYKLYVNGVLAGSTILADGGSSNPMSPIRIGYGSSTSETVYYGEFILFPSALSSDDLNTLNINQGDYFVLGPPPNTWTGVTSNAWNTASNWTNATVPDNLASVTIPGGTPNAPVITSAVSVKKITINSGTNGTLTVGTNGNLSISDSLTVSGTLAGSGTGTVTMNGGVQQVISGTGTIGFVNLTISNTVNQILVNNNINVTGTLTVNAGATFTPVPAVVINSSAGSSSITGSGTIKVTRIVATADYQNQYKFNTNTLTNLTVDYAGAGNQTINLGTNHGNVAVSGSGVKSLSGASTISNLSGNITIQAATLDNSGNAMTGNSKTFTILDGATFKLSGTTSTFPTGFTTAFSANSTVEYAGSGSQTIAAVNYGNLTSSGSGGRTLANSGNIGISGAFTEGTNTYTNTSSTIDYNGTGQQTISAFSYNNLIISGARTGSPNITLESGIINVGGTMSVTATGVGNYIVTGNTVNFSAAGTQTVPSAIAYNNLTLSGSGSKTTSSVTVNGIRSLEGTATVGNSITYGANSTLQFNGRGTYTVTDNDWPVTFSGSGGVVLSGTNVIRLNNAKTINYATYIGTSSKLRLQSFASSTVGLYFNGVSQVSGTWSYSGATNNNTTYFTNNGGTLNNTAGVKTWNGSNSTWNTAANWTPNGVPDATNDVIIPSGTVTINTAATCRNLTINSGATLSYTGSNSLTIASNYTNNGTANFGSCPITFTGSVIQNIDGFNTTGAVVFEGASNQTVGDFSAGTVTVSKTGGILSSTGTSSASSLTFSNWGATLDISGSLTLSGAFTLNSNPANSDVSVTLTGVGSLTCASMAIGTDVAPTANSSVNTHTLASTISTLNVTGNLTLLSDFATSSRRRNPVFTQTGGSLTVGSVVTSNPNAANSSTFTLGANTTFNSTGATPFSLSGTGTNTITLNTSGCVVNFNGTSLQTLPATALTFATMKVNNAAGVTLGAGATIPTLIIGDVTPNSIFNDGGFTVSSPGLLTITSGIYNLGSSVAATTWPAWSPLTMASGTTIGYASGQAQTVSTAITYKNLAFSGGGTKTVAAGNTLTVTENWSTSGGLADFTTTANAAVSGDIIGSGPITVASGTISVAGAWTNSGTLTAGAGTINYNGLGAQTIGSKNYNNLTISNTRTGNPTVTMASGTIGIASTFLTTASGVLYNTAGNTVDYNGTGAQSINAFNYNNLTISAARTGSPTITFPFGTVGIAGSFLTTATGVGSYSVTGNTIEYNSPSGGQTINSFTYNILTLSNNTGTQTAGGAINTTTLNNSNASSILNMSTNTLTATTINNSGILRTQNTTATPIPTGLTIGGTVTYDATTGGQTIRANNYTNLTVSNSSGTNTLANTGTIGIAGTFTPGNQAYTNTGSTINFNNATGGQTIPAFNYNNLTVSNSSGTNTLANSGTIGIAGTFTPGSQAYTITGSTLNFNNPTGGQTIPAFTYNILTLGNASGTQTAGGAITTTTLNNSNTGSTLNMGANSLSATTINNSGILRTQNTTATPIPTGLTIGGTVTYDATTGGQTIRANNYTNLTVSNSSGTNTLANTGTIGIAGAFTPGNQAYTNTGSTINFNNATGGQTIPAFNYNNLTVSNGSGTNTLANTGTIGIAGAFTPGSQAYTIAGSTLNFNNPTGGQTIPAFNYNNLTVSNSSGTNTLANSGTIGIAGVFSPGSQAFTIAGSTLNFNNPTGGQTIPAFSYNNLTVSNGSGTNTLANSGTIGIAGAFTPGSQAHTITGSTLNFNNSTGGQTIPAFTYNILTLGNTSGTQTAAGAITTTTLNNSNTSSTLNMGANILSATTINNSGILRTQSTSATALPTGLTIGGTVTYDATNGGQTIRANNYTNLTVSNGSGTNTLANTGTIGIAGTFTPGNQAYTNTGSTINFNNATGGQTIPAFNYNNLTVSNSSGTNTLANSGTIGIAGTFTPGSQAYTITGSTLNFNNPTGGQTIPAFTYNILTLGNASGTQTAGGAITTTTLNNSNTGSTLNMGANALTATTINNNGIIRTQNTTATPIPAGLTIGGTVTYDASGAQTVRINTYGNLVLDGTGNKTLAGNMTVNNITVGGSSVLLAGSNVLTVLGDWVNNSTLTPNSSSINFEGSSVQTMSGSVVPVFNNLTINNASGVVMNAPITVGGLLSITNGKLAVGSNTLTINGTISSSVSNSLTSNGSSNITIGSSGGNGTLFFDQTIPGTSNKFATVTINRSGNTITLGNNMEVGTALNLTAGKLAIGNNTLTLSGTLSSTAANSIVANGSSSLIINGSGALGSSLFFDTSVIGTTNRIANLTFNRSSQTITLGSSLQVSGTVTPAAGTLASAGRLTLVSNATGTARIADGGCTTCSYITGNVTVQRYVPAVARRWRFLGSTVQNATLSDWKNETFITGTGGASNGFDATGSNAASVFSYNETLPGGINDGWTAATNITNSISAGKGYRIFIRGDRTDNGRLTGTVTNQNEVTLDLVGEPYQGNITLPVSFTSTGVNGNDGWNLVANPYASPYNWKAFYTADSNTASCFKIDPTIWVLNAQNGGYTSYNAKSDAGNLVGGMIPAGASFWVKAYAASPALIFKEQYKGIVDTIKLFKTNENEGFNIQLYYDSITWDDVSVKYHTGSTPNFDAYDIRKLSGTVTISAYGNDSVQLAYSCRPVSNTVDTVRLNVVGTPGSYKLKFGNTNAIAVAENVWLFDTYTSTVTDLKITDTYNFNIVSGVAASQGLSRFYIVVGNSSSLPVKLLQFKANKTANKQVELHWTTAQETNSQTFDVQRSVDGKHFHTLTTIAAQGNSQKLVNYQALDESPLQKNYYRLKQIDMDGSVRYSGTKYVLMDGSKTSVALKMYPIPAKDRLTIEHTKIIKQLTIYDVSGLMIGSYAGSTNAETIDISRLKTGVYIIEAIDDTDEIIQEKFLKE